MILQIDPKTKEVIGEYSSIASASKDTGIDRSSIYRALNTTTKTNTRRKAGEYYWERNNPLESFKLSQDLPSNLQIKKVWTSASGELAYSAEVVDSIDYKSITSDIDKYLKTAKKTQLKNTKGSDIGVFCISDMHIGVLSEGVRKHDLSTVADHFTKAQQIINEYNFKEVHIFFLGDTIESFSGLNHPNSWMNLAKNGYGPKVIIQASEMIEKFLAGINNIRYVGFVEGNHDRMNKSKQESTPEGANYLISYIIKSKFTSKVTVEYDPILLTKEIDGINYIAFHGHHEISNKTSELMWRYGKQGRYNVLVSGHTHKFTRKDQIASGSIATRTTAESLQDDYLQITCPPFFPGNFFWDTLGTTFTPGLLKLNKRFSKVEMTYIPLA